MPRDSPDDPFAALEREAGRQLCAERASKALLAARARLILGRDAASAFFATLALRLTPVVDWDIPTMATDGRRLDYHPEFVTGLSPDELLGVLVHEVMHNALAHHARRDARTPELWNIACDLAVNPLLLDSGYTLPAGRLLPGVGEYAHLVPGKSAESYYAELERTPPEAGEENADPGGCGGVREPKEGKPERDGDSPAAVAQAREAARGRGDLPEALRRFAEEIVHPPVDWRAVLREFVSAQAKNDYSWSRPNRRYLARGWYLPGLLSDELGEVVIAIDTSGSVGARDLGLFAAEVKTLLDSFDGTAVILDHDTEIRRVREWKTSDGPMDLDLSGGGGTSHVGVFDWVARRETPPACVICLTDLATRFPDAIPDPPVLWAVPEHSTRAAPFGRRLAIGS